jgi:hypothetical protein
VWNLVRKFKRGSSLFIGVGEYADTVKLNILDEGHQLFKVSLSLARKASDKCSAHCDVGNSLAHALNQSFKTLSIAATLHQLQHILRCMLQRHVEVVHSFWFVSNRIEKTVADVGWIGVHHPHPLNAIRFCQLTNQARQSILLSKILTVARRILGYKNQLFDAFFR